MLKKADPNGTWDLPDDLDRTEVALPSGERARARGATTLEIVDAAGELIFAYDAAAGVTRLRVPAGSLQILTDGDLELGAAGRVRLHGREVQLQSGDDEAGRASVELRSGEATLESRRLAVQAERGDVTIDTATWVGRRLRGTLGEAKVAVGKLRWMADTVRSRAREAYHVVEGLSQTRAGRVRTLVEDSFHLRAQDLFMKARRDTKIDGEQIYLG